MVLGLLGGPAHYPESPQGQLELVTGAVQEQEERLGYFVLATNHLDPSQMSDLEVLEWYKEQD